MNGITSASVTVLTILVITDLTAGSGRFNLARGAVGAASGAAASVSTMATGVLYQHFGQLVGFLSIATIAAGATVLLAFFQPETKPAEYKD